MEKIQIKQARLLGFAGLIPFLFCVPGFYFFNDPLHSLSLTGFTTYSAIILSFIGAVHWGYILTENTLNDANLILGIGVIPALVAWLALLLPPLLTLIILVIAFPSLFSYEKYSPLSKIMPDWYLGMRLKLTFIVTLLHVLMLARILN